MATGLAASPAAADDPGPGQVLADGLGSLAGALAQVGASEVLMEPLPMSTRSAADVLSISPVLVGSLRSALGDIAATDPSYTELEQAIDDADATVGAADADFEAQIVPAAEGDGATVSLDIAITTHQEIPVSYREVQLVDEAGLVVTDPAGAIAADPEAIINEDVVVSLAGGSTQSVAVDATFATSIQLTFDPAALPGDDLRVVGAFPTFDVSVTGEAEGLSLTGSYGFADVTVAGDVHYALDIDGQAVDPDETGGIRRAEWEVTLAEELFPLARRDVGGVDDVDVALTFDSPQVPGETDGTLTWLTSDASAALGTPVRDVTGGLALFRNLTAADALLATTHFASAVGSLQLQGDVEVPFTDSMLSRAFSPATALQHLIQQFAAADIRCGHANTSPPVGEESTGDTWYCQAYTGDDPDLGTVQWELVGDGAIAGDTSDTTVGVTPTSNVTITGVQGRPDVRVTWAVTDDDGQTQTYTGRPRFRTAGELEATLTEGLEDQLPSGATIEVELGTLDDNGTGADTDDTIEYAIRVVADPDANEDANLTIGDALRAGTGLSGVRAKTDADEEVAIDFDDVELDIVLGVGLATDLEGIAPDDVDSRTDRFYLRTEHDDDVVFRIGDLTAGPTAATPVHAGQVGFLGVDVEVDGLGVTETDAGQDATRVTLVDPTDPAAGSNTIGNGARLLRHVALHPELHSTPTFNLESSGTVTVTPAGDLGAIVPDAVRSIDVEWTPLVPDSEPVVTPDDAFLADLRPFDVSPTVGGFATGGTEEGELQDHDGDDRTPHIAVGTFLEDTTQDFTTAFGFRVTASEDLTDPAEIEEQSQVAGTLLNITTGASCELFEVVTPTTLECVDGLVGGVARDDDRGTTVLVEGGANDGAAVIDNSWHPGDRYEVKGDATALGRILVEGMGDLANDLEQHEALDARLPIIGIEARELVPQFADILDDTLVPILARIGEVDDDTTNTTVDAITTLQELDAALQASDHAAALAIESLATPLSDDLVPHLVLRIGAVDHDASVPLSELGAELSARALRLGLPAPPPSSVPEATVSSSVRLDIGVPLSADVAAQRLLVLATTGVTSASLSFDESELDLTGTYGPLTVKAGTSAKMTGEAENAGGTHDAVAGTISGIPDVTGTATGGSTTTVTDAGTDFHARGVTPGGTLTRTAGGACTVSAVAQHTLTCAAALTTAFASGDAYSYAHTSSKAEISTTADLTDVLVGDTLVVGTSTCTIATAAAGRITCSPPSTGSFATGATFEVESPKRVRYSGSDVSSTYGNGDRLVNLTQGGARCSVETVTASTITCMSGLNPGSRRWEDGDEWALEKGGAGSALFVAGAGFDDMEVEGGTVRNLTDGSSCTITSTTEDTAVCDPGLTGGTDNTWRNGDDFEISGVASARIDATLTLAHQDGTTADPVLLDGATVAFDGIVADAPRFADVVDVDLDGPATPNRCGAAAPFGGDACFRLSLSLVKDDGTEEFLGVAAWSADVDGGNAVGTAPQKALAGAEDAEISLNEIATATVFLSDLFGEQLDGYSVPTPDSLEQAWDPSSTLLPLIGADLSAAGGHDDGTSVEDTLLALGGVLAGLEDFDLSAIDTAAELQTAIDDLLLDDGLSALDVGPVGASTVQCVESGTPAACADLDLKLQDDIRVTIGIGRNLSGDAAPDKGCTNCGTGAPEAEVAFDMGLPGLDLTADAVVESQYAWKLDLVFGISRSHGPYIYTAGTGEFVLGANVAIPDGTNDCDIADKVSDNSVPSNTPGDAASPSEFSSGRCFDAQLGLLQATVFDGDAALSGHEAKDSGADWSEGKTETSRLDLQTVVDLAAPGSADRLDLIDLLEGDHASTTAVDADANIDLWFVTGKELPGGNIPQIQGGLHFAFDQDQLLTCAELLEVLDLDEDEQQDFTEACTGPSRYPIVGDIEYRDMVLDLRTFFSDLLGPWIADVAGVIGTIRPVADILLTPIPGISQLAELTGQQPVTAFSLMQEISGNELTLIYNLLEFIQFADVIANGSAETVNDDDGIIGIGGPQVDEFGFPTGITSSGGYKYDADSARGTGPCGAELPTIGGHRGGAKRFKPKDCKKSGTDYGKGGQASKVKVDASLTGFSASRESENIKQLRDCPSRGCTGKELARTISKKAGVELGAPGIWFPFLADANEIFGMLHGDDAQLVRLDLGTLKASIGLSISFGPFMAGPVPIEIGIGGSITASMRTMVGLDTLGLRTSGKLLDGFFIEDLDPLNGYDVYEMQVVFTISVYAAVSLRFIKAGLEGEIEIGIGANLQDPDGDGRVRPDELTQYGGEWWCAFALEGYLSFVARIFVELDFKLWSKRWAHDLFRQSWVLFNIQCDPDPPLLAVEVDGGNAAAISGELGVTVAAGDLVLNAGPRADERNIDEDETEEAFTVRQIEATGAGLAACPPSTDLDGDGDTHDDGCPPPPPCPGTSPTVCTGVLIDAFGISQEFRVGDGGRVVAVTHSGATDDSDVVLLLEGSGADGSETHAFELPSLVKLGDDKDRFTGGEGPDEVYGGAERDMLEGGGGDDSLYGEGGTDSLKGEIGSDLLDGGADADRMSGGPGADLMFGGTEADSLTGGPGLAVGLADRIARLKHPQAQGETDAAWDARIAAVVARVSDVGDTIVGGAGADEIAGQLGDDLLVGDGLDGYAGAQTRMTLLDKHDDATLTDALCGAPTGTGDGDRIEGATGDDTIVGGPGNDQLMGGRGDDLLCGLAGHDQLEGDDENARIPGGDDRLRGGSGEDRLLGRGGDDHADGEGDNDLVEGGVGNDRLAGGGGSDVVIGDVGHDVVLGDSGTMAVGDPIDDDADADARVSLAAGHGDEGTGAVTCGVLIGVIDGQLDMDGLATTGGDPADDGRADGIPVIDGKLDMDRSTTADAADNGVVRGIVVSGGELDIDGDGDVDGDDDGTAPLVLHVGDGDADCLLGGDGDDGLFGGPGPDFLLGDGDEDYVAGNGGADEARGGAEDDVVRGGPHGDVLFGDGGGDDVHGDAGDDDIFGGSASDHLEGNAGSDTIAGEGGTDVVIGGSSVADAPDAGDTLDGNDGNDIIIGDNGTATNDGTPTLPDTTLHDQPLNGAAPISGEFGDDTMNGGAGVDWMFGGSGADTMTGDGPGTTDARAGADHLEGNAGGDSLFGEQRADDLIGGSSYPTVNDTGDTIVGGADADRIVGDNALLDPSGTVLHDLPIVGASHPTGVAGGDQVWGGDGTGASTGADGADTIYGQSGDDLLHGQTGDDYVEGNSGKDTLWGASGVDDLIGGSGHDQGGPAFAERVLGDVDDGDVGGAGDTLYGGAGVDYLLGDNADVDRSGPTRTIALQNVPFAGAAAPAAELSGNDTIWGDDGGNAATGPGGDDVIYGQSGDDAIHGEDAADVVEGGDGDDTLNGNAGADDLVGGSGKDQGGAGGAERLLADVRDGDDTIDGGDGADLVGGDNAKTWRAGSAHLVRLHDVPFADAGLPSTAVAGHDQILGGAEADELYGQSGDDTVSGQGGDDRIEGGDGADTIRGQDGDDDAIGGSGHDDGGTAGALRELPNVEDRGDTISGGAGTDHLAGDNASQTRAQVSSGIERRTRLHDIPFVAGAGADPDVSGDDTIYGDDNPSDPSSGTGAADAIYGQSGNDTAFGQAGDDYIQGNDGQDSLSGNEGGDDLVGGSSHDRGGANGALRKLADVRDDDVGGVGDTIHGDDATSSAGAADLGDVIAGDNAYITSTGHDDANRPGTRLRTIELFDVTVAGGYTADAATAGPDLLSGDAGRDIVLGQGDADVIHGDDDDDHLEGNHGDDVLHGDADRDDIIGGSSVNPGGREGSFVGAGAFPAVTNVADGDDTVYGDGSSGIDAAGPPPDNVPDSLIHSGNEGEDAVLADNGRITRSMTDQGIWRLQPAPYATLLERNLQVSSTAPSAGAWGDDTVWAGEGHDEVHGQLGDDTIHGNAGDDAVMGDLGRFTVEVIGEGDPRTEQISADGGFIAEVVYRPYTLFRLGELYATSSAGGDDWITGGVGNDAVHAGAGQDTVSGHGDIARTDVVDDPTTPGSDDPDELAVAALDQACQADLDQVLPSFTAVGAPGQLACDEDQLFGGDGDDRMWGGPGHDHLLGGHNPGLGAAGDHLDVVYPGYDPEHGNVDVDFKGVDFIFGGWGQDAMQADVSAPNPNGLDKLIDAAGAYNAYFVCEGAYGGHSVVRLLSPAMLLFLERLATADGAHLVTTPGSSGHRETAIIYRHDMRSNTKPVHTETPANFVCGDAPA